MLPEKKLKMTNIMGTIMTSKFNDAAYINRRSLLEVIEIEDLFSMKKIMNYYSMR